jgi:hypothetical protein
MRTKTATQRDQDRLLLVDLTTGDGDVEGSGDGDAEGEDKEEEGFSGMLADAILKRPESIRDGSFRSMRKDSRGKLANGNGNAVGGVNKGEINMETVEVRGRKMKIAMGTGGLENHHLRIPLVDLSSTAMRTVKGLDQHCKPLGHVFAFFAFSFFKGHRQLDTSLQVSKSSPLKTDSLT